MNKGKIIVLILLCVISAGWSLYLVDLHNDAVAQLLEPGALCGEDGGCGQVLASEWSTYFGIPVSAPGVPLYLTLALLSFLGLMGRLSAERLSAIVSLCALGGLAIGGFLLYHMLLSVEDICGYCLTMDGLNLAVLLVGASVHPDGLVKGFATSFSALGRLLTPKLEALLIPAIIVGTLAVHSAMPEPELASTPVASAPLDFKLEAKEPEQSRLAEKGADAKAIEAIEGQPKAKKVATQAEEETKRVVLSQERKVIPLPGNVPIKGNRNAPVTISLFEDFQCPFCQRLAGNIEGLLEVAGDDVRVAWYHFPMNTGCNKAELKRSLHPYACNAAKASFCAAKQGKFWAMHDLLFQNNAHLKNDDLLDYAKELGLREKAFNQCMVSEEASNKVLADSQIGADLGVRGTPTFFVNGRRMVGAQPVEVLNAAVQAVKQAGKKEERLILDVPLEGEVLGRVSGVPGQVKIKSVLGNYSIDAFEASLDGKKAVSQPGVETAHGVTWYEARDACAAAGKRLCTEAEWLGACTGKPPQDEDGDGLYSDDRIRGRLYPYGSFQQETYCASFRDKDDEQVLITGNHPKCVTPNGIYDLEGLTKEWVGLTPDRAGVKGGSFYSRNSARCGYFKDSIAPDSRDPSIGFRCCSSEGDEAAATESERFPGGKVGDQLLDWRLPGPAGSEFAKDDFAGKPVIMTFWASWCGPCRKELPALAEMYEKYKDQGLVVLGVNVDTDRAAAQAFLQEMPLPFPVAFDTRNFVMNQFDTRGVPTTFWITAEGEIRQRTIGYDPRGKAELEENVKALLKL